MAFIDRVEKSILARWLIVIGSIGGGLMVLGQVFQLVWNPLTEAGPTHTNTPTDRNMYNIGLLATGAGILLVLIAMIGVFVMLKTALRRVTVTLNEVAEVKSTAEGALLRLDLAHFVHTTITQVHHLWTHPSRQGQRMGLYPEQYNAAVRAECWEILQQPSNRTKFTLEDMEEQLGRWFPPRPSGDEHH